MRNRNKSKKINSFLLTMIMIISLFFFVGCDFDGPKVTIKIIYRPYSTSRQNLFTKTYGELIEENLLDVSEDVLTRLVGAYGLGDVDVKDGNGTETVSPSLEEVSYSSLLGASLSDNEEKECAEEFSKVTSVFYSQSDLILVLSNFYVSAGSLVSLSEIEVEPEEETEEAYVAQTSGLESLNGGGYYYYDDTLEDGAYYYRQGDEFAYVFLGSGSGASSITSITNVEFFVSELTATHYNHIQRFIDSINVQNEACADLDGLCWKYSLSESEYADIYDSEDFLSDYVDKFQKLFAVELSRAILTRYEGCELSEELQVLYDIASDINSSEMDQYTFIGRCCEYIDHYGLMECEKDVLTKVIKEQIIGEDIALSSDEYETRLNEILDELLTKSVENNECIPLLEYKSYICNSYVEDVEIDGYVQSIVIIGTDEDFDFSSFIFEFDCDSIVKDDYDFTFVSMVNNELEEYPFDVDEEEFNEDHAIWTDISDGVDDIDEIIIKKSTDPLSKLIDFNGIAYLVDDDDEVECFCHSQDNTNTGGFAWIFNDDNCDYVQVVFGTRSLCINNQFNIFSIIL